ncbi:hypothetical protein S7711_01105, partial [Stachybotrys chartarum IBT 7711]
MSLFGSSPPGHDERPAREPTPQRPRAGGLFDEPSQRTSSSNSLFADDDAVGDSSPWEMPTPRKKQSRADLVRNLLSAADVPDTYIETFDTVVREDGRAGRVHAGGVAKLFASARLNADAQARIMSLVAPSGTDDLALGRNEFNVLLALVGLAQEGEVVSLDGVDERRRDLPQPKLAGLTAEPVLPPVAELAAKPPQAPGQSSPQDRSQPEHRSEPQPQILRPAMSDPEDDPWNSPEVHKHHNHPKTNGNGAHTPIRQNGFEGSPAATVAGPAISQYVAPAPETSTPSHAATHPVGSVGSQGGWGYFDGSGGNNAAQNSVASPTFDTRIPEPSPGNPFSVPTPSSAAVIGRASGVMPPRAPSRHLSGRTGSSLEEHIIVSLMPEKEGVFLFQHHNYEVISQRRSSKVVRRYSDFVWLLDCLHKRYPFRVLPLLPPKRVAVNGNHLSNDGAFIEKRRRGLSRFLNAVVRHPILSQEQLVVMFLTVPTELAVWRKQATISVQDEFTDRALPPGLEDSLPSTLEDLFARTRAGVRRSAEMYINICLIMDRLVKRNEGVAADHARVAMSIDSLTEVSADTYASDTNEVALLNDGLAAMSKHLRTCQSLMEDESRGWDEGVLEDLKRQRDALVSLRETFDRRERLDKDNIPYLERRIQTNETKLAGLRAKPE